MKPNRQSLIWVILVLLLSACTRTTPAVPENPAPTTPQEKSQITTILTIPKDTATSPVKPVDPTQTPEPIPTATATSRPGLSSRATGSFFTINEIGLGPDGYVALKNFTSVPATLAGLYLCQGEDCFVLPDVEVAAGETARIAVGEGVGIDEVVVTNASIGELKPGDGEIALFDSPTYDDPKAMLVYLQWGSTPHTLTDLAVEAGLWFKTSYAPSSQNAKRLYRIEESGLWLFE